MKVLKEDFFLPQKGRGLKGTANASKLKFNFPESFITIFFQELRNLLEHFYLYKLLKQNS